MKKFNGLRITALPCVCPWRILLFGYNLSFWRFHAQRMTSPSLPEQDNEYFSHSWSWIILGLFFICRLSWNLSRGQKLEVSSKKSRSVYIDDTLITLILFSRWYSYRADTLIMLILLSQLRDFLYATEWRFFFYNAPNKYLDIFILSDLKDFRS